MEWINFYYQPQVEAMIEDWVNYLCPVPAAQQVIAGRLDDPSVANSPLVFPPASMQTPPPRLLRLQGRRGPRRVDLDLRPGDPVVSSAARARRSAAPPSRTCSGCRPAPGSASSSSSPLVAILSVSLMTGNSIDGFTLTWNFSVYPRRHRPYSTQFGRSFLYGCASTAIALVVMYPVAYWIAFHGGRHKSTLLFLVLLPFFVSFVIRILSWQFILADQGIVLGTLKDIGLLPRASTCSRPRPR